MKTLRTLHQINYAILFGGMVNNYKLGDFRYVEAEFNKITTVRICTEVVIPYAKINK